jgi:NitT/TauT family transport system substrate-binding protein
MHFPARSTFLGSLAGAASAAALARPAAAADTVRIGVLGIDMSMQPYYAQLLGTFEKSGLTAELMPFNSGSAAAAALTGGSIDVSFTDTITLVSAHAHGVPLSYIAPGSIHTPDSGTDVVIVAKGGPIQTAADFNGKTVAVNGIKNILQIPLQGWIDNNGGDSKTVKFVEIPFPAMAPAVANGTIDAAATVEPFITISLATANFREVPQSVKAIAPSYALGGWAVRNDWAAANPTIVRKLVAMYADTAKWGNTNHAQSAQVMVTEAKTPADLANKMRRCTYSERLTVGLFQPVIDAAAKYGVIATSFPARDIFNPIAFK